MSDRNGKSSSWPDADSDIVDGSLDDFVDVDGCSCDETDEESELLRTKTNPIFTAAKLHKRRIIEDSSSDEESCLEESAEHEDGLSYGTDSSIRSSPVCGTKDHESRDNPCSASKRTAGKSMPDTTKLQEDELTSRLENLTLSPLIKVTEDSISPFQHFEPNGNTSPSSESTNIVATAPKEVDMQKCSFEKKPIDEASTGSAWCLDKDKKDYFLDETKNDDAIWPRIRVPNDLYERLYSHQKVGVQWIASMHTKKIGGILGDDMGMGKTFQTLTYLGGLMRARSIRNALIVAPVSLLRTWQVEARDIVQRCCAPRVTISVVSSDIRKQKRCDMLVEALTCSSKYPHLVITTFGLVGSAPLDFVPKEYDEHWNYVVLDEGHKIKNTTTKISRNCRRICRNTNTRRLLLTGTPIQNNLQELWALFDWATSGRLLGKLPRFRNRYAQPIEEGRHKNATEWVIRIAEKASNELQDLLRPHFLQRLKKSTFEDELPTKRELVVWTHLSEKQRRLYEDYVKNGAHVASVLAGETSSPLEALIWLKKICGHPCLGLTRQQEETRSLSHKDVNQHQLVQDSAKLQILIDLLKRLQKSGHRTLVFSQSTRMLDIIQKVLIQFEIGRIDGKTKEKDRQLIVDQFNGDQIKVDVLLLSTRAAGLGLTLTGADRAVIYDPSWNPADDAQAVDRCYRIGQRKNVTVYRLITAGTVEEKMYEKQVHKDGIRRTILTNGGSATERYFDKTELRRLFELAPAGKCAMLEKVQQVEKQSFGNGNKGILGGSGKPSFLESHPSVVGLSSHDLVYTRAVIDVDKDQKECPTPFDGTPSRAKTIGRSARCLSGNQINFDAIDRIQDSDEGNAVIKSKKKWAPATNAKSRVNEEKMNRQPLRPMEVETDNIISLDYTEGVRDAVDKEQSLSAAQLSAKNKSVSGIIDILTTENQCFNTILNNVDTLLETGRLHNALKLALTLLEEGNSSKNQKLQLHKRISRLGCELGWL